MYDKLKSLLLSRRFWVAISGVIVVVTGGLGLPLSADAVTNVVVILASWILGDSITKTA